MTKNNLLMVKFMVLSVENLKFSYDERLILDNINFEVQPGEFVSILGVNGCGKTTLIKCLNKIHKADEGIILVENKQINKMFSRDIAKIMGYVPQHIEKGYLTVFDAVLLGRRPYIEWNVSKDDMEITKDFLRLLNLDKYAFRYINELSGGELQKVAIARALVQNPKILLLDEPTSGLDLKNQMEVMEIIKKISSENKISSIVIVHDINLALRYCDKFIMIKNGEILVTGDIDKLNEENIREVYGVNVIFAENDGISYIIPKSID